MCPALFFFLKIALAIWGLLWLHRNLELLFFIFVKNAIVIFIGVTPNL